MDMATMKKVGLVTLHGGGNYGNALQHVAMTLLLRRFGFAAETLRDTTVCGFSEALPQAPLLQRLHPGHIRDAMQSRILTKRRQQFTALRRVRNARCEAFLKNYITYSEITLSNRFVSDAEKLAAYDAFLVGSDQVWNPLYPHTSSLRFLQFAPQEKRIAYAPSFGASAIPEKRRNDYAKWLSEIPHLSVREASGARLVADLTGQDEKSVPVLPDPTLCIDAAQWEDMACEPSDKPQAPFLFCYFLGMVTPSYRRAIYRLAKARHLSILSISEASTYDPAEFLWLLRNADFVCTDSFHGAVFSLLFCRPFAVFSRAEPGFSDDDRIATLLRKLGITGEHLCKDGYIAPDYAALATYLTAERQNALSFLQRALEKAAAANTPSAAPAAHIEAYLRDKNYICSGCRACETLCPQGCIRMQTDAEGFLYPAVDTDKCCACANCIGTCKALPNKAADTQTYAYAAINSCTEERFASGSGGIFILLAKEILRRGGIVFGATVCADGTIHHIAAEAQEALLPLLGSKYVESDLENTHASIREALSKGQPVLFCGTPCQVAGILAVFGQHTLLYTTDLLCHGVPSPKAWRAYLQERLGGQTDGAHISFRNKSKGWKRYSLRIETVKRVYCKDVSRDSFLRAFLRDACLRPACYTCRHKGMCRPADITLGDFWGVQQILKGWDDDKGCSLLLTHSQKGEELLSAIETQCKIAHLDAATTWETNTAATKSATWPTARYNFLSDLDSMSFSKACKKNLPFTWRERFSVWKDDVYYQIRGKRQT